MADKKPSIQVILRAGDLLDALAHHGSEPATLKVLAAEAGLHSSTAFRILAALVDIGLVQRNDAGHYSLGMKLRQLGCQVKASADLRGEAKEIMEDLREQVGETVNLAVRQGDEMVYVERVASHRMMRVEQVIGSRAPLHVTAVGKLMLGEEGDQALQAYAQRTGLPEYTEHTLTDLKSLRQEIEITRDRGYALDNEEAELGVGCMGVLIRDFTGNAVAGLSVSAPIERRKKAWVTLLQVAGQRLSEKLGYLK